MGVKEARRMPELERVQSKIDPNTAISPTDSVTEAKGRANVYLNSVYSGDDSTARKLLATLFKK